MIGCIVLGLQALNIVTARDFLAWLKRGSRPIFFTSLIIHVETIV
jgi:hypothetical protein